MSALFETAAVPAFWIALLKIIWVNVLLSGDNAVVIALAARSLPAHQQKRAILFGSAAAILLRIVLTLFAVQLLQYPYLKLVGAALLFWIGVQLLQPEQPSEEAVKSADSLWTAIRIIVIADLVMSVDNVLAVAAAAESGPSQGKSILLLMGLGLSIPLIMIGSQALLKIMTRWPLLITLGAGLLGFVAGEMAATDPSVTHWVHAQFPGFDLLLAAVCATLVVFLGSTLARRVRAGRRQP
jgi:YjbE family integral membrane protein